MHQFWKVLLIIQQEGSEEANLATDGWLQRHKKKRHSLESGHILLKGLLLSLKLCDVLLLLGNRE